MAEAWPVGLLLMIIVIALANLFLKIYDMPVSIWLIQKYSSAGKGPLRA